MLPNTVDSRVKATALCPSGTIRPEFEYPIGFCCYGDLTKKCGPTQPFRDATTLQPASYESRLAASDNSSVCL